MIEATPQRMKLLEELYALKSQHVREQAREEPEVYETSLMLVMREYVNNWESNAHIGLILEEASDPERLQAAREFLVRERETVSKT